MAKGGRNWLRIASRIGDRTESSSVVLDLVDWFATAQFTDLSRLMSHEELAEAYRLRFFKRIGDHHGDRAARAALVATTKAQLVLLSKKSGNLNQ